MKKIKMTDWFKLSLPILIIVWGLGTFLKNSVFFLTAKTQVVGIKNVERVLGTGRFSGGYTNLVLDDEKGTVVKAFSDNYSPGDKIKVYYDADASKNSKVYYSGYFTDPWLFVLFGVVFFMGMWKQTQKV
jgi:hypothetical protein